MDALHRNDIPWEDRFTYQKLNIFRAYDLHSIGARFQIVKFLPETNIDAHYHKTTTEVFYVLSGAGYIQLRNIDWDSTIPTEVENLDIGSIILIEPGDIHQIVNDSRKDLEIAIFKVNETVDDIYWVNDGKEGESDGN
jgi:quercetin dioxygenase-like cupin family protein